MFEWIYFYSTRIINNFFRTVYSLYIFHVKITTQGHYLNNITIIYLENNAKAHQIPYFPTEITIISNRFFKIYFIHKFMKEVVHLKGVAAQANSI